VQTNVKTQFGAKTMAFDAKTQNLFLVTADFEVPANHPVQAVAFRRMVR
jgi:hypothetical protein